jgi:adenylate kinase
VSVAFIGPVGAGKTTQARRFARALPHYNPRLSSGELVRAHIEAGTELGRRMRGHYDRGEAVPDEMLLPLILPSIRRAGGWILDNFPASVAQAGALDAEQRFDEFLVGWPFERDDPAGVTRLAPPELGVRVHSRATGLVYHLENDPPPRPEENLDPGPFERREDDAEEAIRHQLGAHGRDYPALREHYEARGLLSALDARRPIEEVADDVLEALGHPERPEFYALGRQGRG